jgi:hypothetical protein
MKTYLFSDFLVENHWSLDKKHIDVIVQTENYCSVESQ